MHFSLTLIKKETHRKSECWWKEDLSKSTLSSRVTYGSQERKGKLNVMGSVIRPNGGSSILRLDWTKIARVLRVSGVSDPHDIRSRFEHR